MQEPKQWDLTPDEIIELEQRSIRKRGAYKLLAELQQLKGYEVDLEAAWWEALTLRLKIPRELRFKLITDYKLRKVWVKGEVKELDNIDNAKLSDNPAY